jgi:hypothetical protein
MLTPLQQPSHSSWPASSEWTSRLLESNGSVQFLERYSNVEACFDNCYGQYLEAKWYDTFNNLIGSAHVSLQLSNSA